MDNQRRTRSSTTTISIAEEPISMTDGNTDDVFIAQALLNNPRNALDDPPTLNRPIQPFLANGPLPIPQRRQHAGTSNTWTSSEGEMVTEADELDNRVIFVAEYNCIAERVFDTRPITRALLTLASMA